MKTKLVALGALFASLCISVQGQTPLLHLSFESTDGTTVTNDGSGGSAMDGTLNGTASVVVGGVGHCLQVTGAGSSDASCRIPNAVVPLNVIDGSTWTVAMWVKTTTQGGTYAYQGDGGWASGNTTFAMVVNNGTSGVNGPAAGGVRYASGWQQGTTPITNGVWHHIVITCNGTTKVQYIDGVVDAWVANQWNNSSGTGSQFWIGGGGTGQGDGQVCLNGFIDEVNVYDQALSQSQVQALYASQNFLVPVVAAASPSSGYRGSSFTLTATATPSSGTVTNVTVDLSSIGLSATAPLVLSATANVFTNSFTVPATAPIAVASLNVTVKTTTDPFIGIARANFTVVAFPPTNAIVLTPISPASVYQYTEASFTFATTNDAPKATTNDVGFPMTYAWYKNTVLVSTNAMGPNYTFLTTPADNGAQIYAIARVADTNFSSISVTSAVVTLTVNPGSLVYTNGLKREFFAGATRANAEIGNTRAGAVTLVSEAQLPGGYGDNYSQRFSGYFIPPTTDSYVFFIASDDDCDLFLSLTDTNPNNKVLIAQETGWSGALNWQTAGGGGSTLGQKRSDQWSPDGGATVPYSAGIPLVAGQKYYFESVMHQGGGGDNWAVTYQTITELGLDPSLPLDGTASRMTAASNNIAVITWPGTYLAWSNQPPASVSVFEGLSTNIVARAGSDAELSLQYQWYLNNAPYAGATSTNLILSSVPIAYNGAQIYLVARRAADGLSITSSVTTLTVNQAVFEAGFLKSERWNSQTSLANLRNGTLGTPNFLMAVPAFAGSINNPGGQNNFVRRISGYFLPPATTNYVFYTTGDDDSDLFLSTDSTPGNKRIVCHQDGWNNGSQWAWQAVGGGGANTTQMRSSTYLAGGAGGILLTQGQRYYIEQIWHQGGGGANNAATFVMIPNGSPDPSTYDPAAGTPTALTGSVIGMSALRCSYVAFTKHPSNIVAAVLGTTVSFKADGVSDSTISVGSIFGYEGSQPLSPLAFQWYTNGVLVPGNVSGTLQLGPITSAHAGMTVMCKARALGYTDNSLNPIYTNSLTATIQSVVAPTPAMVGHWLTGTASLADTANYIAPGLYNGAMVGGSASYFTNDVPPSAPSGALSLRLVAAGISISNTVPSDAGYVVDTFDGTIGNQFTVAFWAKGNLNSWDPWVSKNGESSGWQMRKLGWSGEGRPTFTMRGSTGDADPFPTDPFDLNQWHYYAGTFDTATGTRNLYVDGKLENQQTGQGPYTLASNSRLMIGARDTGSIGNYYTGNLYDVRIYNYALTQGQIVTIGGVPPPFTSQVVGGQLVLTWPAGTLLQATNVLGPWTTNSSVSPATIDMTLPQQFFRVKVP